MSPTITLTLGGELAAAAKPEELRDTVRVAVQRELERLGLSAHASVDVFSRESQESFEVRVNDQVLPFEPSLLPRLWDLVAPISGEREKDDWPTSALANVEREESTLLLGAVAAELTLALVRRRPEVVFDEEVANAYLERLAGEVADAASIDRESWAATLRSLIALTGTLGNRPAVFEAVSGAERMGLTGDDVVESAFAAIRSDCVEVHAAPADLDGDEVSAPAPIDDDRLFAATALQYGLPTPAVVFVPEPALPPRRVLAWIAGAPGVPLRLPDGVAVADAAVPIIVDELAHSRQRQRLLSIDDLACLLERLRADAPAVTRAALSTFTLGDLLAIARLLLHDEVPLRDLRGILDRLLEYGPAHAGDALLAIEPPLAETNGGGSLSVPAVDHADFVRAGLADLFASWYAPDGYARVVRVDPELEAKLAEATALGEVERRTIRRAAAAIPAAGPDDPEAVLLVTSRRARRLLHEVLAPQGIGLAVLADVELSPRVERRQVTTLA